MIKEFFKTIKDYFVELFATYKEDAVSKNSSSKPITKGGFYTIIHKNSKDKKD